MLEGAVPNFKHAVHPVAVPALSNGRETAKWPVLIAGGGPVGLAMSLALAQRRIPTLVVEADNTVCVGSRAICLSRRTLEILARLGAVQPFLQKGLAWTGGRSFYRRDEVLHFSMPHDDDQRFAPMTNLQQYYIEQFLLDAAEQYPNLIEIRWGTRVENIRLNGDEVAVELATDATSYATQAGYVIACDGARSRVRQALGLRLNGTSYEGRYVIVDIAIDIDLPTERLAWFDPPSNPGRTMLMHKQPDNVWRLDYQLHPNEDPDQMLREENVIPVIEAHLAMMGIERPWQLLWTSMYRAAAVSLDSYSTGRVLFSGDAAHLVPIFGVRGLNSGFDDAFNLGWKLASIIDGVAPEGILDSYSQERKHAWQVNIANAMKSTEFMAPPSPGHELMRGAVLSLAKNHPALAMLINPRQSSAITYVASNLSTITRDETSFTAGPQPGAPVSECPLVVKGATRHLTELLGNYFTLAWYGDGVMPATVIAEIDAAIERGLPVDLIVVGAADQPHVPDQLKAIKAELINGRFTELYDAAPSAAYLFRPDGYVCARWRALQGGDLMAAIETAMGRRKTPQA